MAKHKYDIEDEKHSIRNSIKRIACLLAKTPTQKEYKNNTKSGDYSLEQILYRFGNWSEAVKHADLQPNPLQTPPRSPEIEKDDLINEYIRVSNELCKIPGNQMFRAKSKYSWTPYKTRWGSWRNAVEYIQSNYRGKFNFEIESDRKEKLIKARKRLTIDTSLLYEPTNEMETIVLFCLLAKKLGFKIKSVRADFPDAIIEKNDGKEILVEFEYLTSNYIQHCHPQDFKGICICWRKDVDIPNIEVLSIEDYIRNQAQQT